MGPGERIAARIFGGTGLAAVARKFLAAGGRFAVELHGVPSQRYDDLPRTVRPTLAGEDLELILDWLARRFQFLTPVDFLETDLPGVLLTFDDGFANNHDVVLPILRKWGAPAVFFASTAHLNGGAWLPFVRSAAGTVWSDPDAVPETIARDLFDGMSLDQLKKCGDSELVTIGAHGVSHPKLTDLGEAELAREIGGSRAALQEVIGTAIDLFAYPFGDTDDRVARAVEAAGFRAAFVEGPVTIASTHLAIPRVGIYRSESWYLAAKFSGLRDRPLFNKVVK